MGVDASSETLAARVLERRRDERAGRLLAPVRVAVAAEARRIQLPAGMRNASWRAVLVEEGGGRRSAEGVVASSGDVRLPFVPPVGYHRLAFSVRARAGGWREGEQRLIVAPARCPLPAEVGGRRRVFGILANLYTLRSARNWGIGDLTDLGTLVDYTADAGGDFVGINPLHALGNRGAEISPYSPVSRLYRNLLYLDVAAIPEMRADAALRAHVAAGALRDRIDRLRSGKSIDYAGVEAVELPILRKLHRSFAATHRQRATARGIAYRRYLSEQGEALDDFATFMALRSHWRERGLTPDFHQWAPPYRSARSPAVAEFRRSYPEEVDFHRYIQFELDHQMALAAARGRRRGLSIGIYQDLALGSSAGGSDAWAFPGLFVRGVNLGAPPDDYAAEGQDWGLPPLDPHRLAEDGYRYWTLLLRASFAHSGALRIDHVMGLFRQFWIPAGRSGSDGAYVRFPFEELAGILALESRRAGALVIGEDLGTVPRGLPSTLWRRGILSNRVLYFGRDRHGTFWPARSYPEKALVSANTHDMIPLAGFWEGTDLSIKRRVGLIASAADLGRARAERERERRALVRRLRAEKLLAAGAEPDGIELCRAVHAFLCRTRSALAGISLDDLAGETAPVNQPGVPLARYASWSRRMRLSLEELSDDPGARRALGGTRSRARRRRAAK